MTYVMFRRCQMRENGDCRSSPVPPRSIALALRIREIMTRNPVTITADATIGQAAKVMLDNRVSGLPVVDATGALLGIVTESDIFHLIVAARDGR